jgi:site-specific DNA recombinase
MAKAVLYARVSSREQEKEGYSIPAQLNLLREYAKNNDLTIVQEFTDAETAKKSGRTNYNEMLQFLKKNKSIKIILVEKTDRLYRNFKDYVTLEDYQLEVHLVKEGSILSESSKSHEKFIHGIKVLMAKNYIDNLSEEVKKGFKQKAELGEYPMKPPLGYKRLDSKRILIDIEKAPFVLRAFNLYAEGNRSLDKVAEQLYKEGFIYSANKTKIGKSHLEGLLKNVFYTGYFLFKGKVYEGIHEPLISQELFDQVQVAFKKDNKPLYRDEHSFAFAGLLKCGVCASTITAEIKKGKYIYYHCTHGKGECNQTKYVREEVLVEQFMEVVQKIRINQDQKSWIIEGLKQSNDELREFHEEKIKSLIVESQKLRERINKIYVDKLDGIISESFWLEKHNKWTADLNRIQDVVKAYDTANKNYLESGIKFLELANMAYSLYLGRSTKDKAQLLNILLSNCTLKDGIAHYEYKKPFDILAKGLSCTRESG